MTTLVVGAVLFSRSVTGGGSGYLSVPVVGEVGLMTVRTVLAVVPLVGLTYVVASLVSRYTRRPTFQGLDCCVTGSGRPPRVPVPPVSEPLIPFGPLVVAGTPVQLTLAGGRDVEATGERRTVGPARGPTGVAEVREG